jgi:general secretion pathway protein G
VFGKIGLQIIITNKLYNYNLESADVGYNKTSTVVDSFITPFQRILVSDTRGFSLVELIVGLVIIGVLSTIAVPLFAFVRDRAKVSRCETEIRTLDKDITSYLIDKGYLPNSLNDVGRGDLKDPWGNLYVYHRNPVYQAPDTLPLNSDFDLYSKGIDGNSAESLTSGNSNTEDDIIRGCDGGYVGSGFEYGS